MQAFHEGRPHQAGSLWRNRRQEKSEGIWRLWPSGCVPAPLTKQFDSHSACRSLQVDRLIPSTRLRCKQVQLLLRFTEKNQKRGQQEGFVTSSIRTVD